MRVPITITVAFGNTISIAHRDTIANALGDAIGAPVRVTFATAVGDTYSDPERIPEPSVRTRGRRANAPANTW